MASGRPIPAPPEVKQTIVRQNGLDSGCHVLVETGTFLGAMLVANRRHFLELVSIELSEALWVRASRRLGKARNVRSLQGDSASLLPAVVAGLNEPAVFWLDAHYSYGITARGDIDTPIVSEIAAVLSSPVRGNIVLIDDVRDFGQGDYPSIETIRTLIAPRELEVVDDIVRFQV